MKIKTCGHCGNEKLTPERRAALQNRFAELQGMGVEKFRWQWLKVNEQAIEAAVALNIDTSDPRMRALLSLACFRILSAILPPKETTTNDQKTCDRKGDADRAE